MQICKKKRLALFWAAGVALILVSFYFDAKVSVAFSLLRGSVINNFFLIIGKIDNEILLVLFLTIIFLWKGEKREWVFPLWITVLVTGVATFILKYSIKRPRPFIQGIVPLLPGVVNKASYHLWDFSFPSFDTALVFCALPLVWKFFPRFRYVWLAFSVIVGLSRIYFGVHFLSDVLAGAALGYLSGMLVMGLEKKTNRLRRFYSRMFKEK